jgi:fatty acid desaturase
MSPMSSPTVADLRLPRLDELGADLLVTTPAQRTVALARPFVGIAVYALAAAMGLWWLTPVIVFLVFVAVVTVTHDVVHGTLGLRRRGTEWALFLTGLVLLESGHAYRTTHLQHHKVFPGANDPEGYPAKISLLGAVLYGPVFLARLWVWAYRRNTRRPAQCVWLVIEALVPFAVVAAGILLWRLTPAVLVYAVMVIVGSWVYPLLTVHLPHKDYGDTPLSQTRTLRGRIIPALFLELTYHLEHHLYPQVPSHHLKMLAERLDPFFDAAGVPRWRVP